MSFPATRAITNLSAAVLSMPKWVLASGLHYPCRTAAKNGQRNGCGSYSPEPFGLTSDNFRCYTAKRSYLQHSVSYRRLPDSFADYLVSPLAPSTWMPQGSDGKPTCMLLVTGPVVPELGEDPPLRCSFLYDIDRNYTLTHSDCAYPPSFNLPGLNLRASVTITAGTL